MPSKVRAAVGTPGRLVGAQLVVADRVRRRAQRQSVCAGVVRVAGQRREREHVVGEEVALAQLDRVDAELERGVVDETFEQRRRLRPAGAAVGAHRGRVGDGDGDVELDRGERVRAVRHAAGATGRNAPTVG